MCEFMGGVYYFTRDCSEKSEGTATATGCGCGYGYGSPPFLLRIVQLYIYKSRYTYTCVLGALGHSAYIL